MVTAPILREMTSGQDKIVKCSQILIHHRMTSESLHFFYWLTCCHFINENMNLNPKNVGKLKFRETFCIFLHTQC